MSRDGATTVTADTPSRDDTETTTTGCARSAHRVSSRSGANATPRSACRKTAHRRRHPITAGMAVPAATNRRARTVFECPACESRQLGVQRCPECGIFGRSLGLGGCCPHCEEPVTLDDLGLTGP